MIDGMLVDRIHLSGHRDSVTVGVDSSEDGRASSPGGEIEFRHFGSDGFRGSDNVLITDVETETLGDAARRIR